MAWFEELSSPETITAISSGIAAILGAIGTLVYKYKQSKKVDFTNAGIIINECKKIAELFNTKKKKKHGKK